MTYQVRVHRLARLDLRDAYEWAQKLHLVDDDVVELPHFDFRH